MWTTVEALLQQVPGEVEEQKFAREIATLPMRMGGLGLKVSNQVRSGGVMGVVGRRLRQDQPEKPRGRPLGGADHRGRIAVPTRRLFG